MARISYSHTICPCRCCGENLDVFVPYEMRFCSVECAAIVLDPPNSEMARAHAIAPPDVDAFFSAHHLEQLEAAARHGALS